MLLIVGVLVLMASFVIGANLRIDSHWLLAAVLLGAHRHRLGVFQHRVAGGDDPRFA